MLIYQQSKDQQLKGFDLLVLFAPLVFCQMTCFLWIALRDRIISSLHPSPNAESRGSTDSETRHDTISRLALHDPSTGQAPDMDTVVTILRAMARGETDDLAAANGMSREELIRHGLLRLAIQHLDGQRHLLHEIENRPVHPQLLSILPTFAYERKNEPSEENSDSDTCPICLMVYEDGDQLRMLPCFHKYHMSCIDMWFSSKDTCPNCKTRIDSAAVLQSVPSATGE